MGQLAWMARARFSSAVFRSAEPVNRLSIPVSAKPGATVSARAPKEARRVRRFRHALHHMLARHVHRGAAGTIVTAGRRAALRVQAAETRDRSIDQVAYIVLFTVIGGDEYRVTWRRKSAPSP